MWDLPNCCANPTQPRAQATARLVDELSLGVALHTEKLRVGTEIAHHHYHDGAQADVHAMSELAWTKIGFVLGSTYPTGPPTDAAQERLQRAFTTGHCTRRNRPRIGRRYAWMCLAAPRSRSGNRYVVRMAAAQALDGLDDHRVDLSSLWPHFPHVLALLRPLVRNTSALLNTAT